MTCDAFAPNPGALDMWVHVPVGLAPGAPLVVVLHGCTQAAEGFAVDSGWIALADRQGFAVLAPQQSAGNNPNRCFNWFQAEDMRRGGGEPASIAAMIETAVRAHGLDRSRVFIAGLSAGGAMAAVMLASYPDLFAGGAIIAGTPYGVAVGVGQAFQTLQGRGGLTPAALAALLTQSGAPRGPLPPIAIWHGEADHVVHPSNAGELAVQWAAGQGLSAQPDDVTPREGYVRSVWRDGAGVVRIERNQVAGLGHGVPLATRAPDALGRTAPYMLEAGVSSTLEIARFWALSAQTLKPSPVLDGELIEVDDPGPGPGPCAGSLPDAPGGLRGLGDQVMSAVSGVPANVQAIIADALARGGLLNRRD